MFVTRTSKNDRLPFKTVTIDSANTVIFRALQLLVFPSRINMDRNTISYSIYIRFLRMFDVNFAYVEKYFENWTRDSAKLAPAFEALFVLCVPFAVRFVSHSLLSYTHRPLSEAFYIYFNRIIRQLETAEAWKQATGRTVFLSFVFGMWRRFRKVKRKPFRCTGDPYFISLAERFVQPVKVSLP